jgi:hypothetical protein
MALTPRDNTPEAKKKAQSREDDTPPLPTGSGQDSPEGIQYARHALFFAAM